MKNTVVRFDVSKADKKLIDAIVERTMRLREEAKWSTTADDRLTVSMDITAAHRNGNRLDLVRLLGADDANFGHDVFGISRYIDRDTGKLGSHFVPRFSAPKAKARGRTSRADRKAEEFAASRVPAGKRRPSAKAQAFARETNVKKMGDMLVDAVFGGRR